MPPPVAPAAVDDYPPDTGGTIMKAVVAAALFATPGAV
jgi:hypothetical protein